MFEYKTESGLLYASKLLNGFVNSDFYDGEHKDELILNGEELSAFFNRKVFKDFLVQRERDYSLAASFLAEVSYQYDEGFGSTLDIHAGEFDAASLFDSYFNMEPYILTPYSVPSYFELEEEDSLVNGTIEVLKILQNSKSLMVPYIKSDKSGFKISNFDTIMYLNDVEVYRLLSLYRYALEKNKRFVGGIITNIYDRNIHTKIEMMNNIIESLESVLGEEVLTQNLRSNGSVVRLIHTFK